EEQRTVQVREERGSGTTAGGIERLDQYRSGRRAVALPQLTAAASVERTEERDPVHVRDGLNGSEIAVAGVLEEHRAGCCAVALPQRPPAVGIITRGEKEGSVHIREDRGERATARSDVLHHHRSGRRAIALPELGAVDSVGRPEKERPTDLGEE